MGHGAGILGIQMHRQVAVQGEQELTGKSGNRALAALLSKASGILRACIVGCECFHYAGRTIPWIRKPSSLPSRDTHLPQLLSSLVCWPSNLRTPGDLSA